jgi:hypothetical protein
LGPHSWELLKRYFTILMKKWGFPLGNCSFLDSTTFPHRSMKLHKKRGALRSKYANKTEQSSSSSS